MRRRGGSTAKPVVAQPLQHRPPAHPRPEHAMPRDAGPRAVGGGQQGVDRLARDVVMDQHLGQPLGQIRRALDGERVTGQREADRTVGVEQHPAHRRPSSSQVPSTINPPGASRDRITAHASATASTRILAQHVERPHQHRVPARPVRNRRARIRLRHCGGTGRADPIGVDLQADDPDVGAHRLQPFDASSSVVTGSAP